MLGLRLARQVVSLPGRVVSRTDELVEHLAEFHQQMQHAREEVTRTNAMMAAANDKLDTLIELSRDAIDRMDRANAGIARTTEQVEDLTPLAKDAIQAMESASATLGQVPFIDDAAEQ